MAKFMNMLGLYLKLNYIFNINIAEVCLCFHNGGLYGHGREYQQHILFH